MTDNNNSECTLLKSQGGVCNVCNGHGTCDMGECKCDENYFNQGEDQCIQTCPEIEGKTCSGHGLCKLFGERAGCLCEKGWFGVACDIGCPGVETTGNICSNEGVCEVDYVERTASCTCKDKFRGEDCSVECPGDVISCNGHGTCDNQGVCTCETNVEWSQPSCKCSPELTCNAKGICVNEECLCFGNFGGENCLGCKPHWFGENCDLYCDPYLKTSVSDKIEKGFGCYGHGSCLLKEDHMECTCNLNTAGELTINGATNYYKSFYDAEINCADCESDYFPKEAVFNNEYFAVACQEQCTPLKCNNRGTCNPEYSGAEGSHICTCDLPRVDPEARCASCIDNWFPEERCDKFCIASGSLPEECDGTIECVQCNGHGTCSEDGDCECTDGYVGDQCQINCNNDEGHECGGHGKCVSSPAQQLLQFDMEQNGGSLFSCRCDPQDLYDNARDSNETVVERVRPEYFGETCDHSCVKPPWKDANECNGMGNCTITLIQAPNAATFDCVTDADCKSNTELTNILSGEVLWSDVKGPFCFSSIDEQPLGCQRSKEDCYDIILHQRPKGMRSEDCVSCFDEIENTDWHAYCENVNEHVQPELFHGCNSIESYCPAKSIPLECKTLVDLTDGNNVSQKLNYHYEYDKRKYPFKISEDYRIIEHSILHDEAESEFRGIDINFKLPNSFCSEHGQRFPLVTSVRENRQYLCNGAIQDTNVCSGVLEESRNNLYFPFQVVCPNTVTSYETYKEAIEARTPGCILEELEKDHVFVEQDGTKEIIETCDSIKNMFPKCTYPSPCDFKPCSEGYICENVDSKAVCTHNTGDFVSFCGKGVFKQLTYTTYQCSIDIPDTTCPRDITFKTNVFQHCIDHNPSTSASQASFVTFEFKAPDPIGFSRIDFGDVSVYIVQGQVQLMEPHSLQSCPIDNPTCTETWRYDAGIWYTIELELNGTHIIMRNGQGETATTYTGSFSLMETEGQAMFRKVRFETDIPSPYSCTYETCDMEVSYRKICSDIIHNVEYPSLLEPKHDILQVCSSIESKQQIPVDLPYIEMEKVQALNWDLYCDFYNAFQESTLTVGYQDLELYTTCQEFVDPLDGNKTCIDNALDHDWVTECENIRHAKLPDVITTVCPQRCYNHLLKDKSCETRKDWFESNKQVIENEICDIDWYDSCVKDTKGLLPGKCVAVECQCNKEENLGITGDACQLHCPVGFDGTACSEDSGLGKCMYTKEQMEDIEVYGQDAYKNVWALTGECHCARQDGDGACDVECRDCNHDTYNGGQIGICDNTKGTCKCLPPFTNINSIERTNWKGETVTVIEHEFNDGNLEGKDLFRIRMMQGRESFVKNALQFAFEDQVVDLNVVSSPPEWESDLTLCKNVFYSFNIPTGHNMILVNKEDCEFLGCEEGRYISMPNYIRKFEGSGNYTFDAIGEFYYLCEFHDTMVSKIIVQSCSGNSVYDGIVPWETIYRDFIKFPDKYWCFNRICQSYDITMLGNLEDTSYRYNYDCNSICPGFDETTQIGCSGHGRCGVNGQCICDPAIISNAVLTVYERDGEEVISTAQVSNSLDTTGYRGEQCQIVCPGFNEETGDMSSICNGHGTCDLAGKCACEIGYTGDLCQFRCPVVDGSICTGHGTCEMAEISVSFNVYSGFSDQCDYFANIDHCKNYAILKNLTYVDVASTITIGDNSHCTHITEQECEWWTKYQNINYKFMGNVQSTVAPYGCYFAEDKNVYFNTMKRVACGEFNTKCVCKSDTPDITYCSQYEHNLIVHTKGGAEYLNLNGLYTYEKMAPYYSLQEAKRNCDNCLAIQQDPPNNESYYVIEHSTDIRLRYNRPYTKLDTICAQPIKIASIYPSMDKEDAIFTCMKYCEADNSCNTFKIDDSSCYKCKSYTLKQTQGFCMNFGPLMYEAADNPCTGDMSDCVERCANACLERKTPIVSRWNPYTWSNVNKLEGFQVATIGGSISGKCYCMGYTWDDCPSQNPWSWRFYEFDVLHEPADKHTFYFEIINYATNLYRSVNETVCESISVDLETEFRQVQSLNIPSGCVYISSLIMFNKETSSVEPSNDFRLLIDTMSIDNPNMFMYNDPAQKFGPEEYFFTGEFHLIKNGYFTINLEGKTRYMDEEYYTTHRISQSNPVQNKEQCQDICIEKEHRFSVYFEDILFYEPWSNDFGSSQGHNFWYDHSDRDVSAVLKNYDRVTTYPQSYECKLICEGYYHCSFHRVGNSKEYRCYNKSDALSYSDIEFGSEKGNYGRILTTLHKGPRCICSSTEDFVPTSDYCLNCNTLSTGVYDQSKKNALFISKEECKQYADLIGTSFKLRDWEYLFSGNGCLRQQFSGNEFGIFYNECEKDEDCKTGDISQRYAESYIVKRFYDVFIRLIGNNDESINQNLCEYYALVYKKLYFVTHSQSIPKGCSVLSMSVFYNSDSSSSTNCGEYWCVQYTPGAILPNIEYDVEHEHYVQNELVSGEKYTNYLKTPESLCINEEALQVEASIQSPIINSLRNSYLPCIVKQFSRTCNNLLTSVDCEEYVNRIDYLEFTTGTTDLSLSEDECRIYFGEITVESSISNPAGCYHDGTKAYYNTFLINQGCKYTLTATGNAGSTTQEECRQYANSVGKSFYQIYNIFLPKGCYYKIGSLVYYNSVGNGPCELLRQCVHYHHNTTCVKNPVMISIDEYNKPAGCIEENAQYYFNVNGTADCSSNINCICSSGFLDKTTGKCTTIENEPIVEVTIVQDRDTENEIDYTLDCQILSSSSVKCTQCNCFKDFNYGYWDGVTCSTCSIGYGKSQCKEICPSFDGETYNSMCDGFGECLFGSEKLTVERVFQQANCVCGQDNEYQAKIKTEIPDSTYSDAIEGYSWYEPVTDGKTYTNVDFAKVQCSKYNDVNLENINRFCHGVFKLDYSSTSKYQIHLGNIGTEFINYALYYQKQLIPQQSVSYEIQLFDLQTKIQSSQPYQCKDDLSILMDGFDICNHFNLNSDTCNTCEDTWSGKNCRNKCQKCLARGSCDTTPDENSNAKCICPSGDLWEHQCCPAGFMVTDLIKWQAIPQRKIDQIKLQSYYDPYTTNILDASYHCKKCPGVLDSEWLNPSAIFKVCSGESRGECVVNSDTLNPVCECKTNELTGTIWKGRACSCDDSLDIAYNTNPEIAEVTDYGCLIPTNGQAICPEANAQSSKLLYFNPFMLSAIGKSIDGNFRDGDKYLGPKERLSSPISWTGGIAFEIAITDGPHGKCDDETPCHTGEGPCISDSDCAGGLLCNNRIGSESIKNGYDTSKKNMFYRYCYDPIESMIGCDPIPTFREFDATINFYNYKYWDGTSFSMASTNHYVPMSKDANNNLIIHKRDFPCPKGKYGVVWDGLNECALCPQGQYQDEIGQSSCKTPCLGVLVGVTDPDHCIQCEPGETPLQDGSACEACPNGKYEENSLCFNCPVNTYQFPNVIGQHGVESCTPCPAGSSTRSTTAFIDNTLLGTCLTCEPGRYGNSVGEGCENCPVGKYGAEEIMSLNSLGYTDDSISKEDCEAFAQSENMEFQETYDYGLSAGCSNYLLGNIVYWNTLDSNQECLFCIKKQNYYFADKPSDYVLDQYISPLNENECRTIDRKRWGGVTTGGIRGCHWDVLLDKIYFNRDVGECSDSVPGKTCIQRVRSGSWVTEHTGLRLVEYTSYEDWMNPFYNKKPNNEYSSQSSCLTECETLCARFQHLSCHQESSVYKCMCSNNALSTTTDSTGVIKSRLPNTVTNCHNCKKGTFTLNDGQTYCEFCAVGRYKGQSSDRECTECSSGKYQNEIGMVVCKNCQAGKYQKDKGKTSCKCCPVNEYQNQVGQSSCKTGSEGKFLYPGSNNDYCMIPNKASCATGLTTPPLSYHLEIRRKKTVSWSGSFRFAGYYSNAISCANRCYYLEPTWRGFRLYENGYCLCASEGGVLAIKRCWYESSDADMYSILRCPMIPDGRQYYDKNSYNSCRL